MGTEPARTPQLKRRKRYLRLAGAVLVGVMVGYLCKLLPADHQLLCHLAAKILGIFVGSP
jgi:hypothetical protein